MSEYWLISVPAIDDSLDNAWKDMESFIKKRKSCEIFKFEVPNFKIHTLDILMSMADELKKLDPYVRQVFSNIACSLNEFEDPKEKAKKKTRKICFWKKSKGRKNQHLLVEEQDLPTYITNFEWDTARYPIKNKTHIVELISKQVERIDTEYKTEVTAYVNTKSSVEKIERKQTGSLLTRDLGELVNKDHFVQSEYMTTLLVVVQKSRSKDWETKYGTLSDMVVPDSSQLVFEDNEHGLHTVIVFKKSIKDFKLAAIQHNFIVRDFVYDEEVINKNQAGLNKLQNEIKLGQEKIVSSLKSRFGEAYSAWMHLKALQVYVESILRYGPAIKFQAAMVHPLKKTSKSLRKKLNTHFEHLDPSFMLDGTRNDYGVIIPDLDDGNEYFPYVNFTITLDMNLKKK